MNTYELEYGVCEVGQATVWTKTEHFKATDIVQAQYFLRDSLKEPDKYEVVLIDDGGADFFAVALLRDIETLALQGIVKVTKVLDD